MRAPVVIVLLSAALTACGRTPDDQKPAPAAKAAATDVQLSPAAQQDAQIEVAPAAADDQPDTQRVPGRIALAESRSWRVGIRTDGLVVAVYAELGDYVRKDQLLARYHADEVRDSRALYGAARANLARAESAEAQARRNLERHETLLELKAASQVQVEQARQDLATASTSVRNAAIEVDRLKDLLEDDLRVPAEPKPGDETADQVPIYAPASGYVLAKNVTLGKAIDTEDDTFVIGDLSELWMLASVRQEQLGALHVGQTLPVTVAGVANGQSFPGRVANLGQVLDAETRTMQVRLTLSNPGMVLRPGMLASVDIPVGTTAHAVSVPSDAIQQVDGQDVVFVRTAPDRFSVRPVETAATSHGRTRITNGLNGDEQVVVRGSFILKSQLLRAALEEGE